MLCLYYSNEEEINDAKMSIFFYLIRTLIKHQFLEFVFSLWIVDEFEKLSSLIPNTTKDGRSLFIVKSMSS